MKIKQRMAKRSFNAMAHVLMLASTEKREPQVRRVVDRCDNKWRGSTISGYIRTGDDLTYCENFRMNRDTFKKLLGLLEPSAFAMASVPVPPSVGARRAKRSRTERSALQSRTL